jgi:YesN/AraC family two-component response regulator
MAKILIVEDEENIRNTLKNVLEDEGFEVKVASNGCIAMEYLDENQVDLVITDIIMPEKEGVEMIIELRDKFPELKIIAMSGGGHIDPHCYLNTVTYLGVKNTFTKPFHVEDMINTVKEMLS